MKIAIISFAFILIFISFLGSLSKLNIMGIGYKMDDIVKNHTKKFLNTALIISCILTTLFIYGIISLIIYLLSLI